MCGSEFVNRRFLNWVKSAEYLRSEDELEKKAEELQITLSELLDSPSRQFENRKVDYNPVSAKSHGTVINLYRLQKLTYDEAYSHLHYYNRRLKRQRV